MDELMSREDILGLDDLKHEDVPVKAWGGKVVRIQVMTGRARDAYERSCIQVKGKSVQQNLDNLRAKLVAACAVDQKGSLLFGKPGDVVLLGKKNGSALDQLFEVAQRINGVTDDDVEEMAKNS